MSEPSAVHRGGMRWIAEELKKHGTGGDTEVVHMNKREMALLERVLDRKAKKNPHTGLPSFDEGDGSSGGQGDAAGGSGAGSSGNGTGSGQGSGGGSSGSVGGNNLGDATGGQLSGNIADTPENAGNVSTSDVTGGQLGGTPSEAGVSTGVGLIDDTIQGFLSHPIQSIIDALAGMIPGIGTANSISNLAGGPTIGKGMTAVGRAIGDAFTGSGGFSGTGGEGPSPTGGAGGSEGGLGSGAPGAGAVRNPLTGGTTNSPVSGAGGVGNTGIGTGGSNSGGWDPRVVQLLSQASGKPVSNLALS